MKKTKVLLINPNPNPYVRASQVDFGVPMAILTIGTYLKHNNIYVKIIDGRLYKADDIFPCIDENIKGVNIVGLSVMTAQIKEALKISSYIKRRYKETKILWGGVHPTLLPQQTLNSNLVDFIAIGEGELTSYELVATIEGSSGNIDFSNIKGLGYKVNGDIIINQRRELMSMDNIPLQAFELLDIERYVNVYYPFIGLKREILVQTSRGCPHRCAFCINYVERGYNTWRAKKAGLVLDEIKELKNRYKLNAISFRDENFFFNRKHAEDIIDGLGDFGIRWFANVRADYFNERHVSGELLKKAKDSGVAYFGLGAESGVERILKIICKDITVDQIIFTAQQMNKYNIAISYSFIIGIPGETETDMMNTVELMKKLKHICRQAMFSGPQILRPYPGGALYDLCVKNGYRSPASLEDWAFSETGKFGELSLDNYPWLKNPSLVIALSTYVPAALNYDFMKDLDLKRKIYASISSFRLKFNFWLFPYEYQLAMKIIKYINIFRMLISKCLFKNKASLNLKME